MASKIKPGTKHPSKPGLVMGTKGRYVAKSTYAKQAKAGNQPATKPATKPKVTTKVSKPTSTKASPSSTPKVGATKRLQGRMVRWNGTRWTAAGTGPKQPATTAPSKPTPKSTPKVSSSRFKAPSIPKPKSSTPKTKAIPKPKATSKPNVKAPRSATAVPRALRRTAARASVKGGLVGVAMLAADIAARKGALGNKVKDSLEQGDARMDRLVKNPLKKDTTNERKPKTASSKTNASKTKPKSSSTSTPSKYPTTANLVTRRGSRDYQAEKGLKTPPAGTVPADKIPSNSTRKPIPKTTAKSKAYAADSRNKEYDRLRKAGKLKEAEALGKKIHADKFGKKEKKKKPQSAANKAGYPGNRNY